MFCCFGFFFHFIYFNIFCMHHFFISRILISRNAVYFKHFGRNNFISVYLVIFFLFSNIAMYICFCILILQCSKILISVKPLPYNILIPWCWKDFHFRWRKGSKCNRNVSTPPPLSSFSSNRKGGFKCYGRKMLNPNPF